tara:strand:+ start:1192 stop:1494 length:303 start_codon:yes stop_codon:yes gene_type:complete
MAHNPTIATDNRWQVYIIECSDNCLYTGITIDMARRWRQHLGEIKGGAKFFRGRKPRSLRMQESGHNRSSASKRESEIKKLSRQQKLLLIDANPTPKALF